MAKKIIFSRLFMMLEVKNLHLSFAHDSEEFEVLRGISFSVRAGEKVALVGESGCGKSMTGYAITRLPPTNEAMIRGEILFNGEPVVSSDKRIAYIFQDPVASLNPVMKIERQLKEACTEMHSSSERLIEMLRAVDLNNPSAVLKAYPCELSGGMCQRVMIAMALAREPELLIADEPTTALDVTTQADVMDLIIRVAEERKMSLLLITHNLALVANRYDTVHVLYVGEIVESGPVRNVLSSPMHPYTQGLIGAIPRITANKVTEFHDIPGSVPSVKEIKNYCQREDGTSCAFRSRCQYVTEKCCAAVRPEITGDGRLVKCVLRRGQ